MHCWGFRVIAILWHIEAPMQCGWTWHSEPRDVYPRWANELCYSGYPFDDSHKRTAIINSGHMPWAGETEACSYEKKRERSEDYLQNTLLVSTSSEKQILELTYEKGACNWLNTLPIEKKGYALHKCDFRDAWAMCYCLPVKNLRPIAFVASPSMWSTPWFVKPEVLLSSKMTRLEIFSPVP